MIPLPPPWHALVLGLAAYRLTRLGGWDEFPLAVRLRRWVIGEFWVHAGPPPEGAEKAAETGRVDAAGLGLPGKQPTSEVAELRPAYRRPVLAHLVHCPFCLGWWISLAVWAVWAFFPTPALWIAAPLALSGFVGLVAKNLDP